MRTHLLDTCVCFPAVRVYASNRERARGFEDHVHVCLLDTRPHISGFQNRKSPRRAQLAQTLSQALEAKPYSHTAMSRADAGTHQLLQLLGRWRETSYKAQLQPNQTCGACLLVPIQLDLHFMISPHFMIFSVSAACSNIFDSSSFPDNQPAFSGTQMVVQY